jgi:hypothetical protein
MSQSSLLRNWAGRWLDARTRPRTRIPDGQASPPKF